MKASKDQQLAFLELSAVLTGYSRIELLGTGVASEYCHELFRVLGTTIASDYLAKATELLDDTDCTDDAEQVVRNELIDDDFCGPITLNVVRLWYLSTWSALPAEWRERYGARDLDKNRVVSSAAYKEGLVWDAIGAHPMGAKQPGFGTWSKPPPAMQGES